MIPKQTASRVPIPRTPGDGLEGADALSESACDEDQKRSESAGVTQPLVSILIPAHNAEDWIADTLQSALAQTWPRKEIIVVDDGSTDGTLAVARRFESEMVRVVAQPNQGAAATRNKAFSLCRGDYIQWLDADDLLAPDKIECQVAAIGHERRKLLSCGFGRFMYRYDRAVFVPTALWSDLSAVEWLLRKLGRNLFMQTGTWLMSRELAEAAGPWDTSLLADDDGEYFCRVLLASSGVRFVSKAKMYYRTPWYSSLGYIGRSPEKIRAHWRSIKLHIGYLRGLEDTPRVHTACIRYLQTCLIYFYPEYHEIVREAEQLAEELGGRLGAPSLSWKYVCVRAVFGWTLAKHAQRLLPRIRWTFARQWDRVMLRIENRNVGLQRKRVAASARETSLAVVVRSENLKPRPIDEVTPPKQ
jgi:glycosyltransferase involved in cell wall biosynthesis